MPLPRGAQARASHHAAFRGVSAAPWSQGDAVFDSRRADAGGTETDGGTCQDARAGADNTDTNCRTSRRKRLGAIARVRRQSRKAVASHAIGPAQVGRRLSVL